jgi:hypothetical protein
LRISVVMIRNVVTEHGHPPKSYDHNERKWG